MTRIAIAPDEKRIATEVMGWREAHNGFGSIIYVDEEGNETDWCPGGFNVIVAGQLAQKPFRPFENVMAAWAVVEKLAEDYQITIGGGPRIEGAKNWTCQLIQHGYREFQNQAYTVRAETVYKAVCEAALKAVEGDHDG